MKYSKTEKNIIPLQGILHKSIQDIITIGQICHHYKVIMKTITKSP